MIIGDGPFDLYIDIDVKKLWGGGCTLDYNVSSGPFLCYEIEIGDGPGPELDNIEYSQHEMYFLFRVPLPCLAQLASSYPVRT